MATQSHSSVDDAEYIAGILGRIDGFDPTSPEDRERVQKVVYLLQAFGVDLGFEFRWYVDGVAASDLAAVLDDLEGPLRDAPPREFRDVEYRERFERFREFVEPDVDDGDRLAIAADLHWLATVNDTLHRDLLFQYLREEKSAFEADRETLEHVWDRLAEYGVIG